jgi:F-type H+-transporting ATPase subunit b
MAEEKIAQAEVQAMKDVRAAAADAAIAAATALLADEVKGDKAAGLIDDGIKQLKGKLN